MKLKSIVAMISFLMVAVSCSMEDDVLNEMAKGTTTQTNQEEVGISVLINVNNVPTKGAFGDDIKPGAYLDGTDADKVEKCMVFIANAAGTITYRNTNVAVGEDKKLVMNFSLKTGSAYKMLVVANSTTDFNACTTLDHIKAKGLAATDMNALVKWGEEVIDLTDSVGLATMPGAEEKITVDLHQLTAQISLKELIVKGFNNGTNPTDVYLRSVEVVNQNVEYSIDNSYRNLVETTSWDADSRGENKIAKMHIYSPTDATKEFVPNANTVFTTYPNNKGVYSDFTAGAATRVRLTFEAGTNVYDREFVINRPDADDFINKESNTTYVHAGYIYELYVAVNIDGDTFNCTIKCCTKDWLYNEYEVTMDELTEL
ncbi:hypothetical protein [Parabacteroides sp. PF5-6]|uniref:hypothetical protein n=1 Tax=Parabacteroides sp. PF5-6 TaxID=1742403 RepID=UPI0024050B51|nr:hypothetical protein [Parabacteroides sp. PF5-6]MDF9829896.1 hypothetical protein [Parabacteroides sp. PF5-6]